MGHLPQRWKIATSTTAKPEKFQPIFTQEQVTETPCNILTALIICMLFIMDVENSTRIFYYSLPLEPISASTLPKPHCNNWNTCESGLLCQYD